MLLIESNINNTLIHLFLQCISYQTFHDQFSLTTVYNIINLQFITFSCKSKWLTIIESYTNVAREMF